MNWVEVVGIGAALMSMVFNTAAIFLSYRVLERLSWHLGMTMAALFGGDTDDDWDEGE